MLVLARRGGWPYNLRLFDFTIGFQMNFCLNNLKSYMAKIIHHKWLPTVALFLFNIKTQLTRLRRLNKTYEIKKQIREHIKKQSYNINKALS